MSERLPKLTLEQAMQITLDLLKERKASVPETQETLPTSEPINCPLLLEMIGAANELYYGNCIL